MGRQNKQLEIKRILEHLRTRSFYCKKRAAGQIFVLSKMRHRQDLLNKMRRTPDFLNKSGWAVCPIEIVCNSVFTNHSSKSSFFY